MAIARGALRERLQAKLSVIRLGLPPLRPDRIFALIGADPSSSGPCLVPSIHPSAWNKNSAKFAYTWSSPKFAQSDNTLGAYYGFPVDHAHSTAPMWLFRSPPAGQALLRKLCPQHEKSSEKQ